MPSRPIPPPPRTVQSVISGYYEPIADGAEHTPAATPRSQLARSAPRESPRDSLAVEGLTGENSLDQPPAPLPPLNSSTPPPPPPSERPPTAPVDRSPAAQPSPSTPPAPHQSPSLSAPTADGIPCMDESGDEKYDDSAMDVGSYETQRRKAGAAKRKQTQLANGRPANRPTTSTSADGKEEKADEDDSPTQPSSKRSNTRTLTPHGNADGRNAHRSSSTSSSSSSAAQSPASSHQTQGQNGHHSVAVSSPAVHIGTPVATVVVRALSTGTQPAPAQPPRQPATTPTPSAARSTAPPAAQPSASQPSHSSSSAAQQQQQQRQQANNGNKQERLKAANVPLRLLEQCDIRSQSNTALVLTLRPAADQQPNARPAWAALRRPTGAGSASLTAVAELLTRLHVPLPTLPLLYGKHSTLTELAAELEQHTSNAVSGNDGDSEATDWRAVLSSASTDDERGELLVERAAAITAATHDTTPYATWQRVLHPSSGNMTRRRAGGGNDSNGQPANDDDNSNSRNHNNTDNHCTLKLEFHSPLIRLAVEHHLRQQHAGVKAEMVVEPYRRQLIAARVTGFPVGPIHPGRHELCNDVSELHGNWQQLRQYLLRVAPHCTPARTPEPPYNGLGVVDFVLEESKLVELYKLQDHDVQLRAEHGITRPLRLTYAVLRQSKHTACSRCFRPGHKERDCQQARPPPGTVTCRACYKPGHLARDCTLPAAERHCRMCDKDGHYAAHCAMYRSSWVKVTPPPFKQQHPLQPAPRSSAAFMGSWAAAASGLRLEQPVEEPPQPQQPSQQPHRGVADSASLAGRRKKARLQPAQQQHADEDDDMQTNEQQQPRATSATDVVLAALLSTLNTIQQNAAKQAEVIERMQRDAAEQVKQQAASQEKALASLATTITVTLTTAIAQLLDRLMPSQPDKPKYGYRTDDSQPMAGLFPQHNSTTAAMMEHQLTTQSDKSTRPQPTASPATTAAAARATVNNHTTHCQIQMPLSNPSSSPVQLSGDNRHTSLHIHNTCPAREQPPPTDDAQRTGQQRAQLPPANGGQPAPTAVAPNEQ